MKVAIYFAVYKRLEILNICLDGIERLKKDHPDIDFIPFAVYSNLSEKNLLDRYGVRSLKHDNGYLGRKKNAGLKALMQLDWDYMMEIGSDDLINSKLIDVYRPLWEKGEDAFGVRACYFIDAKTGRVAFWKHDYALGAGRCLRKGIFEGLGRRMKIRMKNSIPGAGKGKELIFINAIAKMYTNPGIAELVEEINEPFGLWSDTENIALDGDSQFRLGTNGIHVKGLDLGEEVMVIDIKNGMNIHSFDKFKVCEKSEKEVLMDFSKKEQDGIWELR